MKRRYVPRKGIVEEKTRPFKSLRSSVSSILRIVPRASGDDNDGPRIMRSTICERSMCVSGKPGIVGGRIKTSQRWSN